MYLSYQTEVNQTSLDLIHLIEDKLLPIWGEESKREIHQRLQGLWEYPDLKPVFKASHFESPAETFCNPSDTPYTGYEFSTIINHDEGVVPSTLWASVYVVTPSSLIPADGYDEQSRGDLTKQITDTLSEHITAFRLSQKEKPMQLTAGVVDIIRHLTMRQYPVVYAVHDMSNSNWHRLALRFKAQDKAKDGTVNEYFIHVDLEIVF